MKLLICCVFAFVAATLSDSIENERNALIILENSRKNFHCGWPDIGYGIPPIDPFLINEWTLNQRQNGMNITTTLRDTRKFGLKNFVTERLIFHKDRRIEYIFSVAYSYMNGTHTTRGSMIGIPVVNGNGPMVSHMTNSRYHGFITWSTHPETDYMYVTGQTVVTQIESMNITMTGFGILDNRVNNQINEQIPAMIVSEDFQNQMNEMFNNFIIPLVDSFMYMQTPLTIGDVLAYYAANPRPPQC